MCIYIMQASISSRTQRITDCRWTPKRRATSAWLTPCCNSLAAAIRRRSKPSKFRFTPAGLPILLSYHMYLYYASLNKSPGLPSSSVAPVLREIAFSMVRPLRFVACPLSGLRPDVSGYGLAGKRFTKHVRLHLPRKRSGHEGVHDAVQPAWNDSGTVFEQTAEALRYALLDAHRFHRHGLRIEAELFEHRCVRKPGCQYSNVDT